MSTDAKKTTHTTSTSQALEFKSSTFSLPVLMLSTDNLDAIEKKLQQKISLAPEFFKNTPLVIDLQEINKQGCLIDLEKIIDIIRKMGLFPVGVRGGNILQNKKALELLIPVYSGNSSEISADSKKQKEVLLSPKDNVEIEADVLETTLITQPVRSGQRIYAAGDLVILAQVSAGAEIIAEGNIHVYNTLRGRALAGVQGNIEARIFCFDLQAELISIAGNYKVSEDLDESMRNKPVQIYLQGQSLIIKEIVLHH
jgi:septum site-determining protein MinC